jgi:SAM-dependent methyltransferase
MNVGYDQTPSFYTDQETFHKYLGQTSYYRALQNAVLQIARYIKPASIAELGSGTGATALALAAEHPHANIVSIDFRADMIDICRTQAEKLGLHNTVFETRDLVNFFDEFPSPDLTVMLYSFHHIPDPLDAKDHFLNKACETMQAGQYLCVGETFLPEHHSLTGELAAVDGLWSVRPLEGYASTFWAALDGLTAEAIHRAADVGRFSFEHEHTAGGLVRQRDGEYLITRSWLATHAAQAGFQVVIDEPVNSVGDGIVLLKKA